MDIKLFQEQIKEVSLDKIVASLVKLEDDIATADALYASKMEVPKKQVKALRDEVLRKLAESNQSTVRFDDIGTVTRAQKTSYTITDPSVFQEYVLSSKDLSMFGSTLLVGGINTYKEMNDGEVPPGVTANTAYTLALRKAK